MYPFQKGNNIYKVNINKLQQEYRNATSGLPILALHLPTLLKIQKGMCAEYSYFCVSLQKINQYEDSRNY